jgi:hypothetical protein
VTISWLARRRSAPLGAAGPSGRDGESLLLPENALQEVTPALGVSIPICHKSL